MTTNAQQSSSDNNANFYNALISAGVAMYGSYKDKKNAQKKNDYLNEVLQSQRDYEQQKIQTYQHSPGAEMAPLIMEMLIKSYEPQFKKYGVDFPLSSFLGAISGHAGDTGPGRGDNVIGGSGSNGGGMTKQSLAELAGVGSRGDSGGDGAVRPGMGSEEFGNPSSWGMIDASGSRGLGENLGGGWGEDSFGNDDTQGRMNSLAGYMGQGSDQAWNMANDNGQGWNSMESAGGSWNMIDDASSGGWNDSANGGNSSWNSMMGSFGGSDVSSSDGSGGEQGYQWLAPGSALRSGASALANSAVPKLGGMGMDSFLGWLYKRGAGDGIAGNFKMKSRPHKI